MKILEYEVFTSSDVFAVRLRDVKGRKWVGFTSSDALPEVLAWNHYTTAFGSVITEHGRSRMEACLFDTGPVIVEISETLLEHPYGGKNEKIRMRLLKISERQ